MDENCRRRPLTRLWWILSATVVLLFAYAVSLGPVHVLVHSYGLTPRVYALYCPLWSAVDLHSVPRGMLDWYEQRWRSMGPPIRTSPGSVQARSSRQSERSETRPVEVTRLP